MYASIILGVFERKIPRKIYGPFCDREEWHIRWNQQLYDIYDDIDVLKYSAFDGWAMSLVWIVFESEPGCGSLRKGRPRH